MTSSEELRQLAAQLLGIDCPPRQLVELTPMDPLMAESVTERFLDRKESYVLIEQFCLGNLTSEGFMERLKNVLETHAVNLMEEQRDEEEGCA